MSHDIRTPMNAIVGMTAIATAHIDDQNQVQNCLRKIALSSKHLLGLINDVRRLLFYELWCHLPGNRIRKFASKILGTYRSRYLLLSHGYGHNFRLLGNLPQTWIIDFQIILLDWKLPGMDGFQVAKASGYPLK